jgi:DNA helicase HerA-like ATPase
MSLSDQLKRAASVDIFKLSLDKTAFVGHPFYFDYAVAHILVADAHKQRVRGIPQGAFLLAFYDNEQSEQEAVLLRALGPTKLPTDQDVIKSMVEYYKDNLQVSGPTSQLDEYTRYEFSFSGLECRVLGTFYKDRKGALVFGADLENFYSAHNYSVFKPSGDILELIVNFREGSVITGQSSDVRIGRVRYSSSMRFQEQEEKEVKVYVSPSDFLGKRTALFGMTRTGKSNTVKKVIQATVEISNQAVFTPDMLGKGNDLFDTNASNPFTEQNAPKYPVGQLIFDINGEYANANLQDDGTAIFEMYKDKVTRFSILNKPGFRVMKTNFFEDIDSGFELLSALLRDEDARYIDNFRAIQLAEEPKSDETDDEEADTAVAVQGNGNSAPKKKCSTSQQRRLAAYKCCLHAAGFSHKDKTIKFPGEVALNTIANNINPSKGITYDQAVSWFSYVWDATGDRSVTFFDDYKRTHDGRDWANDDLKALLVMLTRKRTPGPGKSTDCTGFLILKRALELHTETVGQPYAVEILNLLRQGKIVIADLSQGDPDIIRLYSEKICQRIFSDAMQQFIATKSNNFIQLYFEEAHNLFPKKEDRNLSQIYNRIAKEGAKLNLGIIYATQEVSSISSNILKNTQNWFVAHLNNVDELKEIEKYYDYEDFSESLGRFSASTDKGFIRMKTYSNAFTVPVQVDRFSVK